MLIIKNTVAGRFEAMSCGCYSAIRYYQYPGGIVFFDLATENTPRHETLARKLVEYVLEYARENKLKITPLCPRIKSHIHRHQSEYRCVAKVFMADH